MHSRHGEVIFVFAHLQVSCDLWFLLSFGDGDCKTEKWSFYRHPWTTVTSAFWRKYPNPLYPHVQEVDTFHRELKDGNLTTQRIITATTSFPSFLRAVGAPTLAFGVEQSTVNAQTQTLELRSRNVTGSGFMVVEETCTYEVHPDNPEW